MTLAENLEVLNLRAIAGEYDFQERHIDIAKLPVFLENQQKGNYTVRLDPGATARTPCSTQQELRGRSRDREVADQPRLPPGAVAGHRPRPAQRGVLARHRHARLGRPTRLAAQPRPEYRKKWSTLDVKQANELLDKIGLTKKDAEGYRLRTDNGQRLRHRDDDRRRLVRPVHGRSAR